MAAPNYLEPLDEAQRLVALHPYQVRGTAPFFDEFVRVAAKLFGVPIAVVSLVEADMVWTKVQSGLSGPELVARAESVCAVAILQEETTVFENWGQDPCLLVNPEAMRQLHMQFYAGHPLRTADGQAIGALCILDRQPRFFSQAEQKVLATLAAVAMRLLELQVALAQATDPIPALWPEIYITIAESLMRLDTLTALAAWEDHPNTIGAVGYRRSRHEEMGRIAAGLHQQVEAAVRRFARE